MKTSKPVPLQETADYIRKRAEIQASINSSIITPMSGEAWKKTAEEKRELKHVKKLYKQTLK
jgi:hypothetical protein